MKNLFKKFDSIGLLAFAAAGIFAISWNTPEEKLAPAWYPVTVSGTDPVAEKNQYISSTPIEEPTGDCNTDPGTICAIQLDLNGAPVPATVFDAETSNLTTGQERQRQD